MNYLSTILRWLFVATCTAVCSATALSAGPALRRVTGIVKDAQTGVPMPFVSVSAGRGSRSAVTDSLGVFVMNVPSGATLKVKSEGYKDFQMKGPFSADTLRIEMSPSVTDLQEVVVKFKKRKYKKRNPASELMLKVRACYDSVRPEKVDGYSYDSYVKTVIGINDVGDGKGLWAIPMKDKSNLRQLVDTSQWTAKEVLNLSIKEVSSTAMYDHGRKVEVIKGELNDGLDKQFSQEYVNVFLNDVLREVDLYGNDIHLLRNSFVSPLSRNGINFYHYELVDTVPIGNDLCVELSFAPARPEMTGFNGKLYIPVNDSVKYVRRAMMRMPKATNVNYIKSLIISQNFKRDSLGKLHKTLDDLMLDVQIVPRSPVFYFNRQTRRDNFGYEGRPEYAEYLTKVGSTFKVEDCNEMPPGFWELNRQIELTPAESNLIGSNSVFRRDKGFYWTEKIVDILVKGYIPTDSEKYNKFYFGPINSIVSYTGPGGWRVQLGGMTTAKFMPHLFLRGFGAYGFGDHKWKGAFEAEYSFPKRRLHALEFPRNSIRIGYNYDMDQLGEEQSWYSTANLLGSLKRIDSRLITYRHHVYLDYNKEWLNNLSMHVGLRYVLQERSPWVSFVNGYGQEDRRFGQAVLSLGVRWAPGERFIQTLNQRNRTNRDALVLSLDQEYGPKRLLGSKFAVSKTELGVEKTFWLSAFGYIELAVHAAKIWTQVPFTELYWQVANTSYLTDTDSFSLLNPMEFAMDQFASWNMQYYMNGLIFNHIPWVKKARIREVVAFRGFWGNLTAKNDPSKASNVYRFPGIDTSTMGSTPYMECSVGLENIFTFFRVEYVWRLTYRDRPGITKGGLRLGLHFNF